MPDKRAHRGPHPEDATLFGPAAVPRIQAAVEELAWLLSRGYASQSALKLVGDRHALSARQRTAVARMSCSDHDLAIRQARRIASSEAAGRRLWLDGYNVLTTVEAALGGGVILAARDGTYRDMASMHGSYRKVAETRPALELLGRTLTEIGIVDAHWLLDRPVSNSGRLRQIMCQVAEDHGWRWAIELAGDPDALLAATDEVVATADSGILNRCRGWFNLARAAIDLHAPGVWIVGWR